MTTNAAGGRPLLEVEGLTIAFPGAQLPAVDGASWTLHPGKVTALVGESGSGKSVSSMSVLGLLPPSAEVSGSIRYHGEFPEQTAKERLRRRRRQEPSADGVQLVGATPETYLGVRGTVFSLVSQEPMNAWNPVITLGDQIIEAVRAHAKVPKATARSRALDLLREAGLDNPDRIAKSYPHQLSGGQLQRALIAMALAQDPVAIIADEPTTALDVTVQAGVLDLLRRLRDTRGTAVLLITHDMGVVADLADDVVVMKAGKVVEHAEVLELFDHPSHEYTRSLLDAVPRLGDVTGDESGPAPSAETGAVVALEDIHVTYPGARRGESVHAVRGVSLSIAPGEVLGLVGESGSGKSTLGQVVTGLLAPSEGSVRVAGIDPTKASRAQRRGVRRQTGIIFQDPASTLNPRWTVARSVAEPLYLHTDLDAAATREKVLALLEQVRLGAEIADRFPHELSGGQRQRVAIARAVALDPAVLVADEPTSALDVSVQAHVLSVFAELQQSLGFGCLFISHNLAVVERVADRIAVMHNGVLVEEGPAAQVLTKPQDDYTRALVGAAPVADPVRQAERRHARSVLLRGGE